MTDANQWMWDCMHETEIIDFMHSADSDKKSRSEARRQLKMRGVNDDDIPQELEEKKPDLLARLYTSSLGLAAYTISDLAGKDINAGLVATELLERTKNMLKDGVSNKELLASNTLTLDAVFNHMVRSAVLTENIEVMKAYMDVALRAQNQGRKTLLALEQISNPKHSTFIGQQNNAVNQFVNNQCISEQSEEQEKVANKVVSIDSEISEVTYESMDFRRAPEAIPVNTRDEAMEILDRP